MNNEKMGQFINELRKSKQMTQKDLAEKLNVTYQAVSKWERGLSYPDISMLPSIADALGVTTSELLNGEKSEDTSVAVEKNIDSALEYAEKTASIKSKSFRSICTVTYSTLLIVGIITCVICDLAISGTLTWSLIPISSIVFSWLLLIPICKFGVKGILGFMISLTVFTIPYLYVLQVLIDSSDLIFSIGFKMSVISIIFLWCVYVLFKVLNKRKFLAGAIIILAGIPIHLLINYTLSTMISEASNIIVDISVYCGLFIVAVIFYLLDRKTQKNNA